GRLECRHQRRRPTHADVVRGHEISPLRSRQSGFLHFPRLAQPSQGARRHRYGHAELAHSDVPVTRRLRLHPLAGVEQELRQSSYLPAEIDEIETGTLAPDAPIGTRAAYQHFDTAFLTGKLES